MDFSDNESFDSEDEQIAVKSEVKKGQKHLEALKSSLGLDNFQDKIALKREKRKRQKLRRKLKKQEGSEKAQIQTKATKQNKKEIVAEVVTYLDPKKRVKEVKQPEKPQKEAEIQHDEISMKQARFDVFKFGIKGLDKEGQHEARVALALKLGAKPAKKSCIPYAQLKEQRQQERENAKQQKELDRLTGMRTISARPNSGKKGGGKKVEDNVQKKKKKVFEKTPLKLGKFDGATLRISKKELGSVKGRKRK